MFTISGFYINLRTIVGNNLALLFRAQITVLDGVIDGLVFLAGSVTTLGLNLFYLPLLATGKSAFCHVIVNWLSIWGLFYREVGHNSGFRRYYLGLKAKLPIIGPQREHKSTHKDTRWQSIPTI